MTPPQDNLGPRTVLHFLRSLSFLGLGLVVVLFSGILVRLAWLKLSPEPEVLLVPTAGATITSKRSTVPAPESSPADTPAPAINPPEPRTHTIITVKPTAAPEPAPQPATNAPAQETQAKSIAPVPTPAVVVSQAKTPVLFGKVVLQGTPPAEKPLPMDPSCGLAYRGAKPTTQFYRVGQGNGLADVFVSVTAGLPKQTYKAPDEALVIDQVGCLFVPYVSAVQTGQTIRVRNSDPVLHNVHPTPAVKGNFESDKAQLPRAPDLVYYWDQPETFLRYRCDVHPWMFAYVNVVNHPYFAVTDQNGQFSIPNLPPGEYTVEAYHRKAGRLSHKITVQPDGLIELNFELPVDGLSQAVR